MKNLLFFASDFKIGLSALLSDQLMSIVNEGCNYIAVAGDKEQEAGLLKMLHQHSINPIIVPGLDEHANFKALTNELYHIVNENSIDIIHVQNNWQLALASVVKLRMKFKRKVEVVYTIHGFRHNSPIKSRIAQAVIGSGLFLLADHVICMTKYLKRKFALLSYKIHLIPLGVKDDFFDGDFIAPPTDALHLIFPAQFRLGKNQDIIIKAFADYVKASNDTKSTLTLPGNGPLLEQMKDLAANLGIDKQVIFPGLLTKDEIKKQYLASNVALVASNSETFGQSIVEPYVLGRCVCSTPVGIAPEIITDGENGYFFRSRDELAGILSKIASDKSCLSTFGKINFERREMFDWKYITDRYVSLILK